MRRASLALSAVLSALALAGCGGDESDGSGENTTLDIYLDLDGSGSQKDELRATLACESDDLVDQRCKQANALELEDFEPVAGDVACTEIFGGPETVRIVGTLRGEPVEGAFSRENGCEIERFARIAPLVEAMYAPKVIDQLGP